MSDNPYLVKFSSFCLLSIAFVYSFIKSYSSSVACAWKVLSLHIKLQVSDISEGQIIFTLTIISSIQKSVTVLRGIQHSLVERSITVIDALYRNWITWITLLNGLRVKYFIHTKWRAMVTRFQLSHFYW